MNYRHAYHAGNFADVLKHAVLVHIIEYLKRKAVPFRVIDTHAGVGGYDLGSEQAIKTAEWRDGIGRLYDATIPAEISALIEPYLAVVRAENGEGSLATYPGSPAIARRLLRADDVLAVNELHPDDSALLKRFFAGDRQVKVLELDAWTAVKSLLPPKERRGLVLIDPPFEEPGEIERMQDAIVGAARRFAGGTVMLWYPIKDPRPIAMFHRRVAALGVPKILAVDLMIRRADDVERLNGTGLVIVKSAVHACAGGRSRTAEARRFAFARSGCRRARDLARRRALVENCMTRTEASDWPRARGKVCTARGMARLFHGQSPSAGAQSGVVKIEPAGRGRYAEKKDVHSVDRARSHDRCGRGRHLCQEGRGRDGRQREGRQVPGRRGAAAGRRLGRVGVVDGDRQDAGLQLRTAHLQVRTGRHRLAVPGFGDDLQALIT